LLYSTAEPTAAVIDSQSVRAAPTVPKATRGWDAAKKVNGRKRHIAVDTTGLLLAVPAQGGADRGISSPSERATVPAGHRPGTLSPHSARAHLASFWTCWPRQLR
jgi:hypothetical protein